MPKCFFVGGKITWPLLLSSVAARAVLSLAKTYQPAAGEYPEGRIASDLEGLMWVIFNLVNNDRLVDPDLPVSLRQEREAEILEYPLRLVKASRKRAQILTHMRKAAWG